MECEILRSPMILYQSLLHSNTVLNDIQVRADPGFSEGGLNQKWI